MYLIAQIKGHQYKVSPGDIIDVQKTEGEVGSELTFDDVVFVSGKETLLGMPNVAGAKITVKVIKQDRSRKVIVFKRKAGKYRNKNGHRQHFTSLLITSAEDGKGNTYKIEAPSKKAEKHLK
jgi:large subunit ribosomal protein L21